MLLNFLNFKVREANFDRSIMLKEYTPLYIHSLRDYELV